jgi:hypothetical protein
LLQAVAPAAEYWPVKQLAQVEANVAPTSAENVPATQSVQTVEPVAARYLPAAQACAATKPTSAAATRTARLAAARATDVLVMRLLRPVVLRAGGCSLTALAPFTRPACISALLSVLKRECLDPPADTQLFILFKKRKQNFRVLIVLALDVLGSLRRSFSMILVAPPSVIHTFSSNIFAIADKILQGHPRRRTAYTFPFSRCHKTGHRNSLHAT